MVIQYGALIGAGLGLAGGVAGARAQRKDFRLARKRTKAWVNAQKQRLDYEFNRAEAKKGEALDVTRRGSADALKETARLERTGLRRVAEREKQALASEDQRMTSLGLAGTSAGRAATSRVGYEADRSNDEFLSNFAAFRSDLYQRAAGAEANALNDLADFYQMRYQTEAADYWDPMIAAHGGGTFGLGQGYQPGLGESGGFDFSGLADLIGALGFGG